MDVLDDHLTEIIHLMDLILDVDEFKKVKTEVSTRLVKLDHGKVIGADTSHLADHS